MGDCGKRLEADNERSPRKLVLKPVTSKVPIFLMLLWMFICIVLVLRPSNKPARHLHKSNSNHKITILLRVIKFICTFPMCAEVFFYLPWLVVMKKMIFKSNLLPASLKMSVVLKILTKPLCKISSSVFGQYS